MLIQEPLVAYVMCLFWHITKINLILKAIKCIFLGHPFEKNSYIVYDLHSKPPFHSRNVVFYEYIFPFHSFSTQHSTNIDSAPMFPYLHIPFFRQPHF